MEASRTGERYADAAAKTLQSLCSGSHIQHQRVHGAALCAERVHAHQATEEQKKNLVWVYLSQHSQVGIVIDTEFIFIQRTQQQLKNVPEYNKM